EAVENAIKISIRDKKDVEFGVCFRGSFHGRTLGALSFVTSKQIYVRGYGLKIPSRVLSFNENAKDELIKILNEEGSGKIGFVIMEALQGEGGYNVADPKVVKDIRELTKQYNIPFICDEVQCGMGRTGEWWAINNYNVKPDVMSAAKALQVGATIANKKRFPSEEGAISSTWGGGHIIDMALGIEIIRTIKKDKLLLRNKKNGRYIRKRLKQIEEDVPVINDVRGLGLMNAFDLATARLRSDVVIECFKNGLILLGCGGKGIRLIPPYVVSKNEIDEAFDVIRKSVDTCSVKGFKHKGEICKFMSC
ncbi:MAG TPA: aminotransferase class III-fold pyridoxal phosphate-dependent enzyme, partial [Candidatus Nanoarchaeia archaeon]|nr:aminotransferase class III-fold pyridoxal phosphate-dependent enzyme [Candidatus Nanoarchaeia archaeon]